MQEEEDYYLILEITRDASAEDIKKAYRKQALIWHPDKNPENQEEAECRFKKISEAYEILGDENQRVQYDRYGKNGINSTSNDGHYHFRSAEDIFREFFGRGFHDDFFNSAFSGGGFGGGMGGFGTPSNSFSGFSSSGGFGGFGGPGFSSFSSTSTSFPGGFGSNNPFSFSTNMTSSSPAPFRGSSRSVQTQIVNGKKTTIITERDAEGNETVTTEHPDGRKTVTVNGVQRITN